MLLLARPRKFPIYPLPSCLSRFPAQLRVPHQGGDRPATVKPGVWMRVRSWILVRDAALPEVTVSICRPLRLGLQSEERVPSTSIAPGDLLESGVRCSQ